MNGAAVRVEILYLKPAQMPVILQAHSHASGSGDHGCCNSFNCDHRSEYIALSSKDFCSVNV
jgi:hypothetical protein